jgi:hypothetical protein
MPVQLKFTDIVDAKDLKKCYYHYDPKQSTINNYLSFMTAAVHANEISVVRHYIKKTKNLHFYYGKDKIGAIVVESCRWAMSGDIKKVLSMADKYKPHTIKTLKYSQIAQNSVAIIQARVHRNYRLAEKIFLKLCNEGYKPAFNHIKTLYTETEFASDSKLKKVVSKYGRNFE